MRPASCPRIFCHRALLSHPLIPFPLLPRSYAYLLQYIYRVSPLLLVSWQLERGWPLVLPSPLSVYFLQRRLRFLFHRRRNPAISRRRIYQKAYFAKKKKKFPYSVSLFAICSSSLPTSPNYRLLKSVGSGRGLTPRARWEGRVIQSSSDQSGWGKPLLPSPFLFFFSSPFFLFHLWWNCLVVCGKREGTLFHFGRGDDSRRNM